MAALGDHDVLVLRLFFEDHGVAVQRLAGGRDDAVGFDHHDNQRRRGDQQCGHRGDQVAALHVFS